MQAIVTKYLGPTDTRGGRVKATSASGKTLTVGWRHDLDSGDNHKLAAIGLMRKLGWVEPGMTFRLGSAELPSYKGGTVWVLYHDRSLPEEIVWVPGKSVLR